MDELSKRELLLITIIANLLSITIFFALGGHTCSELDPVEACSALSDMAFAYPTGHAVETTIYEDGNGTLTLVTRDFGASVTIK